MPFTPDAHDDGRDQQGAGQVRADHFHQRLPQRWARATYNRLDGWASKFLEAGAAAFIGSLWAVSDGAAREFAQELYGQLQYGLPLGDAVMQARQAAASKPDDPTWLAYTVYGDPRATISQSP